MCDTLTFLSIYTLNYNIFKKLYKIKAKSKIAKILKLGLLYKIETILIFLDF